MIQRDTSKEFFVLLKIESPEYHQFITQGSRQCEKRQNNRNIIVVFMVKVDWNSVVLIRLFDFQSIIVF